MARLERTEIDERLALVPEWTLAENAIHRTFEFKDFVAAMTFVNQVAELAESVFHHPDIDIRWNKVTLTLSTHSEGGLTEKDFSLARKISLTSG